MTLSFKFQLLLDAFTLPRQCTTCMSWEGLCAVLILKAMLVVVCSEATGNANLVGQVIGVE
jgi:hypothetical protein